MKEIPDSNAEREIRCLLAKTKGAATRRTGPRNACHQPTRTHSSHVDSTRGMNQRRVAKIMSSVSLSSACMYRCIAFLALNASTSCLVYDDVRLTCRTGLLKLGKTLPRFRLQLPRSKTPSLSGRPRTALCHRSCTRARAPCAPAYPPQQHWRVTAPSLDPRAQSPRSH